MPTKKELLHEKTVKELHQMAKDKDMSGYSRLPKDELVDLIEKEYLKREIKQWPDLKEEKDEEEEPEETKEISEETEEEKEEWNKPKTEKTGWYK